MAANAMSAYEDEDGIDGPFTRAMDRAMRDDDALREERAATRARLTAELLESGSEDDGDRGGEAGGA